MTSYDDSFLISYWSASVTALSSDWLKGVMNILAPDIDTPGVRHQAGTIKTRRGSNRTFLYTAGALEIF